MIMAQYEFLPLCDVLFNIISLAAYFCDIVFDVVMAYALYVQQQYEWFGCIIAFVFVSSITQQIISARWYMNVLKTRTGTGTGDDIAAAAVKNNIGLKKQHEHHQQSKRPVINISSATVLTLHIAQLGVFWRYFKLFIPVDLRFVKYEVRDLCMLRLVHAFCESVPLMLIQLYLFWDNFSERHLNMVSLLLSLFSVCWAFASFSKNVRVRNVHRLVLTWLGVIFQFFWRLGTVGARAISLVAYATLFKYWVFLVILLHWVSMLLWILSPKNVFHGERLPCSRKVLFCSVIAFVYTFCYINLIEVNHREKMLMFYVVMGLENAMLMFVWIVGVSDKPPWYRTVLPLCVFVMFFAGLGFMWLYYRYFHVRRLKYEAGGRLNNNNNAAAVDNNNTFVNQAVATQVADAKYDNHVYYAEKELVRRHSFSGGYTNLNDLAVYSRMRNESSVSGGEENRFYPKCRSTGQSSTNNANHLVGGIPGVFNCRFSNPYVAAMQKRKRKKPTSFVPPPSIDQNEDSSAVNGQQQQNGSLPNHYNAGFNSVPFWCRPLPNHCGQQECGSENDCSSASSRPDIHVKLQEKKRKQLVELKKIEEEIRLGKLGKMPVDSVAVELATGAPPPRPQNKKSPHYDNPEILLAPRYLNDVKRNASQCYDWTAAATDNTPRYRLLDEESLELMYKAYKVPSDLDSQLSLPRSYTLPREFKYYRKTRPRKSIRTEHFVPSTNSSDGDVDSGDDSESTSSHTTSQPKPMKLLPNTIHRVRHETKL